MKIEKSNTILSLVLISIFLFCSECLSQSEQSTQLIEKGNTFFKEGKYDEAMTSYNEAYLIVKGKLDEIGAKPALSHEEKLGQKRNIIELRNKLRELQIFKRRARLNKALEQRKEEIAQKKLAAQREKEFYREKKVQKEARKKAEKIARVEAEQREKEIKVAGFKEGEEKKEVLESKEILVEKEKEEGLARKELAKKKKEKAAKEVKEAKARIIAELEATVEREKAEKEKVAEEALCLKESRLAQREKMLKEKEKVREAKKALKETEDQKKKIKKVEAIQKRKDQKETKIREERKNLAIKKANLCKMELSKYAIDTKLLDSSILEKAQKLVRKADEYFEKNMYKEASELYDRGYLILKGKIYY